MLKQNKMWCWRAWVYSARNLHFLNVDLEIDEFLNSSKCVSTPKIGPKYWKFTSSLHLLLLATSFQAPRKCCETYSLGNTISPKLWSEEWLYVVLCHFYDLIHYLLNLYITWYHHLVHTQAGLAFPAFLEKFNFSAHFTSCLFVCLIISLQVGNILRK